jgi:hypothetical protein
VSGIFTNDNGNFSGLAFWVFCTIRDTKGLVNSGINQSSLHGGCLDHMMLYLLRDFCMSRILCFRFSYALWGAGRVCGVGFVVMVALLL